MTSVPKPSKLTAAEIGRGFARGALDPVAVTEHFLEEIGACVDQSIFLTVTAERARAEAEASRQRYRDGRAKGLLDGVPIAWKDLIDIEGTHTTAGSLVTRDRLPASEDAPVVRHLSAAGMVCLGKTNLSEFAFSGIGINPHFGTPHNPHDPGEPRIPGGSSSGSAVAIARGLAPAAIGTDTSGSVRIPAALCGIVGHHSSPGRIDRGGVTKLSMTLDSVGPMARSVGDCALLDQALRGLSPSQAVPLALDAVTAVVPENYVFDDIDEAVAERFEAVVDGLVARGMRIERQHLEELDAFAATTAKHGTLVTAEAYYLHKADLEGRDGGLIDRNVATRLTLGANMRAYDLVAILETRRLSAQSLHRKLGTRNVLLMPSVPHTAPTIASLADDPEQFARMNLRTMRITMPGSFLGLCGLTIPCGGDAAGLPIGLLICGAPDTDDQLLNLGLTLEAAIRDIASSSPAGQRPRRKATM